MTAEASRQLDGALRERLPADALLSTNAEFSIDGLMPAVVVSPASQADAASTIAVASETRSAVVAWGGGNHMAIGTAPRRYDIALDLQRLNRIVEYEPADLTVTVEAGIRLTELNRHLASHGQWLPLDPPGGPTATIGGILASNASGPARIAYGTARDLTIGMTVATAKGELVKSGGRVVKNVAGYDLAKLHIGGLGTLGVITQVSFKVAPVPQRTETLVFGATGLKQVFTAARAVWDASLPCNGLAITNRPDSRWSLAVRLGGGGGAVERSLREVTRIAGDLVVEAPKPDQWDDLIARSRPTTPEAVVIRLSLPPSAIAEVAARPATAGAQILAYPGAGQTYCRWPAASAIDALTFESLRTACEERGGAMIIEAAPAEFKARHDTWGSARGDFELVRRLKETFDPAGILSPGRYIGGL